MVFAIHWHESAMDLHVFPILIPPPASLPIPSLWVFPVHQPRALVPPGLVICFTLDSILVSMLFSQNIPPSPSPTESKCLFCIYWVNGQQLDPSVLFFFNLSIVYLQCCINLCCIAKWFIYMHSHTYTYMHSFLYSLLLWLKQGIEYSLLCRMVGSSCLLILYIMVCIY